MSARLIGFFVSAHALVVAALYAIAWSVGGDPEHEALRLETYGTVSPAAPRPGSNDLSLRDEREEAGG